MDGAASYAADLNSVREAAECVANYVHRTPVHALPKIKISAWSVRSKASLLKNRSALADRSFRRSDDRFYVAML